MGKENIVGDLHAVNQKSSNLKMFKVGKQWVLASKVITLFGTAGNSDSFAMCN
ncbi:KxYKxGKxW signal peptide domain-containing protein [Pediococcus pentosaceus]|uniref:KxYKxGKxW signal peptide domain-containing protein n=1 Tax=Pediococcus pentosaceus TaxID=1255 RepID=UPI0018E16F84|nr:KxYKxGKxW signal peptide domain-containing protein [Pediococcus pentosaceus]MBF7104725.1 KxYKxGKxW signal peptide domain-containing protein [Pediococcus pentosaceus]QQC61189.1 KxYKxGKxW signal peptide domain-containing protein [Pediococcus pentosaceus]